MSSTYLTLAFAESATELEHAAQAKDKDKTKEALDSLGGSCMACHSEHRVMGSEWAHLEVEEWDRLRADSDRQTGDKGGGLGKNTSP